ncbi:MAG: ribonuclease [Elusimicrobiota bacterium]
MMKFAGFALLAVVATAPAFAVDWNGADPVAQARPELAAAAAAPQPSPVLHADAGTPGQFDTYVFSLEWTAAFCEGKSGLPECAGMSGRFDAGNLALHGLWPDKNNDSSHSYGFCGVDPNTQSLDKGSTWCRMPDIGLSGSVLSRLTTDMPGVASCLQNHEWYKHGTCSGYTPDEYFTRASSLVEQVSASAFGRFLSSHVGQTVNASDLLAAWEADFGAGSRNYVSLSCTKGRGASLLLDVRLHLANPLGDASDLKSLLLPVAGSGNCGASFLIDPAR